MGCPTRDDFRMAVGCRMRGDLGRKRCIVTAGGRKMYTVLVSGCDGGPRVRVPNVLRGRIKT